MNPADLKGNDPTIANRIKNLDMNRYSRKNEEELRLIQQQDISTDTVLGQNLAKTATQKLGKQNIATQQQVSPSIQKQADKLIKKLELPVLLFSSISGMGINQLKDALWEELNKEQNQVIEISHAPLDVEVREKEEITEQEDDEEGTIYLNEVEEEWDLSKYKGIGWDDQN